MSSTTEPAVSPTIPPSRSTRTNGAQPRSRSGSKHQVHFVLQGKGGIGKTTVSSLVAQYLSEHDRPPVCFDTDPVNASFAAITALGAEPVALLEDAGINIVTADAMIQRILEVDADVVVDNGAASFIPMSDYLLSDNVSEVIEAGGKTLTIHVIMVGGGGANETAAGLSSVLKQFPQTVRVVVWLNEFFGAVIINGTPFEETNFYAQNRDRLAGVIRLRQQNPRTTGVNLSAMFERKQTFAEVLADPAFHVMPKQRLTQYRRAVWEQLDGVL